MKRLILITCAGVMVLGAFAAGFRFGLTKAHSGNTAADRSVLYYVDPMNPAHTSSEPGLAPCGMKMAPVYAGDVLRTSMQNTESAMAEGAVGLTPNKQRLIGIQTAEVQRLTLEHTLHLFGKVAVDETRIYRINAPVDGRITKAPAYAPGSFVRKHSAMAAYYSPEFLRPGQALLLTLQAKERIRALQQPAPSQVNVSAQGSDLNQLNANYTNQLSALDYTGQFAQYEATIKQNVGALQNLGMGEPQLERTMRTREALDEIDFTAPVDGFVLARNVSPGQSIEKGAELFRIADLSHVWVVADTFESDQQYFLPGSKVQVSLPHQRKTMTATVSPVGPQFDSSTRAMKVRLEVENKDFTLRPDMLVDVEFPISIPPVVAVPASAVLDSGQRQTVYVAKSDGLFEPRAVITGRHLGEQVEIVGGLEPGEQIVTAGNFLLDSESRIRLAPGTQLTLAKDIVCGMTIDVAKAKEANQCSSYRGQMHYFCSEQCKNTFEKDPDRILERSNQKQKDSSLALAHASAYQAHP